MALLPASDPLDEDALKALLQPQRAEQGGGAVIRKPTIESDSVLDSTLEKYGKKIARFIGMDDPNAVMVGGAMEVPGGAPTAIGKALDKLLQRIPNPIKAYHGSPHDFDQFALDKVGTGEGAQAYGHGLYFADKEGVARSYRDNLAGVRAQPTVAMDPEVTKKLRSTSGIGFGNIQTYIENASKMTGGDLPAAAQKLRQSAIDQMSSAQAVGSADLIERARLFQAQAEEAAKLIDKGAVRVVDNPGRMYEVNIHADPQHLLDWDKPLQQQSEHVQQALSKVGKDSVKTVDQMSRDELIGHLQAADSNGTFTDADSIAEFGRPATLEELRQTAHDMDLDEYLKADLHQSPHTTGQSLYEQLRNRGGGGGINRAQGSIDASRVLRDAGIPGIQYLDGTSRAAGEGSRNYVVFDDKLIEVVKKYGVAAALAAGLINEGQARQLQSQGHQ